MNHHFYQFVADWHLTHAVSITVCWLLFFLPLYAVIKSFEMDKADADSVSRVDLFVRPASFHLNAVIRWFFPSRFYQDMEIHQRAEGEITRLSVYQSLAKSKVSVFELDGHSFEYGKDSRNPALDLLENGGVISRGVRYKITYDSDGRIIQLSVDYREWCRFMQKTSIVI